VKDASNCGSCSDTIKATTPVFNLDVVHPTHPPYLGSGILPPDDEDENDMNEKEDLKCNDNDDDSQVPESVPLDVDDESSSDDENRSSKQHLQEDDDYDNMSSRVSSPHKNNESLLVNVDGEDIGQMLLETVESTDKSVLSPTRLFDESVANDDDEEDADVSLNRKRTPCGKRSITCAQTKRMMSTLPSTTHGEPIRLRVTESYNDYTNVDDDADFAATFDPYFSYGQYNITSANGSKYGNGLQIKMSTDAMTLQEGDTGKVVALMRSRHTSTPSFIVYGAAPRYEDQAPSAIDAQWYPWALVKKNGRSIRDDVMVQYATNNGGAWGPVVWRSRHGFLGNHQTHTVVARVDEQTQKEKPCCLVIRDPLNFDVFNVTIAPGIDPLLAICYLAVHSKMDVEPKLDAVFSG